MIAYSYLLYDKFFLFCIEFISSFFIRLKMNKNCKNIFIFDNLAKKYNFDLKYTMLEMNHNYIFTFIKKIKFNSLM